MQQNEKQQIILQYHIEGNFYSFSSFSLQMLIMNPYMPQWWSIFDQSGNKNKSCKNVCYYIQIIRLEVLFFISNLIQHFFISKKLNWVFFFTQNMLINSYFVIVCYIHLPFLHKLCFNPSQCANICFFTTTIYGPGVRYTSLLLVQ